ncbi:MAG: hypothetical protein CFR70_13670 [Rhodocyclaceae bacterium]|nr:MAG: hypothetical protein CFR70_13670 [Rhodocyclaceae bacterium]
MPAGAVQNKMKNIFSRKILGAILGSFSISWAALGQPPVDESSELLRCPDRPNCVSSRVDRDLLPLLHNGPPGSALQRLKATLARFPEASIQRESGLVLETIFTTPLGFRDQVIFVIDDSGMKINFRSRSLAGYYDFGKNRSRMREFSAAFSTTVVAGYP